MTISRRGFLGGSALAALSAACGRPAARAPEGAHGPRGALSDRALDRVIARVLAEAKKGRASYADVRVVRRRTEAIGTREDHVVSTGYAETYGLGVRVIVDGRWGFASTPAVTPEAAALATWDALGLAKAARAAMRRPVELAKSPVVRGAWRTPMKVDPFAVSLEEKAAWLLDLWARVRDVPKVKYARASFEAASEWKLFASSEGSVTEQTIVRVWPHLVVTAVDGGEFESRASEVAPMQAGWEYVTGSPLREGAREIAEDAVEKLMAPSVTPGKKDLVLAPSNLWLTIHESVGHPTELDRAMGYEANFAGTSFATVEKLGKLRYASDIVTLYADKTTPGALATCAWDDDGVPTGKWNLVDRGLFVGYQTTREQAAWIGEHASRGTSYAQDHKSVAFQRMPNVSLAPSDKDATLADLVAATDDGILISGNGSWSIDHQRYNFQFSGQTFHAIENGKIAGALRDVAYHSNSLEFWRSCDMIGGARAFALGGTLWDGKGEPEQANAVSHGCPPARFRAVDVLNVNTRRRS